MPGAISMAGRSGQHAHQRGEGYGCELQMIWDPMVPEPVGIGMEKGEPTVLDKVDAALMEMDQFGEPARNRLTQPAKGPEGPAMHLRHKAYEAFTRHLMTHRLLPGAFVTQRDLAALTGFPLGAIREMIPRLEAEGLVKAFAQRGLQVMAVDPRLVRDAFNMREIIELAAIVAFVRTASDAVVDRQVAAHQAIAQAGVVDAALLARAQAVDWGFHDALVENMGNDLLNDVHRVNAIRIRMMMHDTVRLSPEVFPPALGEHARILDAIVARDEARAVDSLQAHLASARRRALGMDAAA